MALNTLLRVRQVMAKTGRSRSKIYTDPSFPRPVSIGGGRVAWVEAEVDAWIEARIAERDAAAAARSKRTAEARPA